MRNLLLVIIPLLAASCSRSVTPNPHPDYLQLNHDRTNHVDGMTPNRLGNLKGHIRTLTQYAYSAIVDANGSVVKGDLVQGTPVYTLVFSREGLIVEEWGYRVEDIAAYKTYYRDHYAQKIDSVVHWNDQGQVSSREVYEYDKDGVVIGGYSEFSQQPARNKVRSISRSGDTLIVDESWSKLYYVQGLQVKLVMNSIVHNKKYFPSGRPWEKVVTNRGLVEWIERFDESGNLVYHIMNKYDEGKLIYMSERIMTYDDNLRVRELENHFDEPHRWSDTMTYVYEHGRRVRTLRNGEPYGTDEYNEHDDRVRTHNEFFDEGYQYISYDDHGNWTQRVMVSHDKPYYVEIRKIEYFDEAIRK